MLEKILGIYNTLTPKSIKAITIINGLRTDIYYPLTNPSIYGSKDSQIVYPLEPDIKNTKYLIIGAFQEAFLGGTINYDNFLPEECYILTAADKKVKKDSKVVVHFGKTYEMVFKVDEYRTIPGIGPLYLKNMLVPFA